MGLLRLEAEALPVEEQAQVLGTWGSAREPHTGPSTDLGDHKQLRSAAGGTFPMASRVTWLKGTTTS